MTPRPLIKISAGLGSSQSEISVVWVPRVGIRVGVRGGVAVRVRVKNRVRVVSLVMVSVRVSFRVWARPWCNLAVSLLYPLCCGHCDRKFVIGAQDLIN